MAAEFSPISAVVIGSIGGLLTVVAVYCLAGRWKSRSGLAYGLSAFLLYGLLFLATFQRSVVNADIRAQQFPESAVTFLIIGQGAVSALGVGLFTLLLFGLYLAVQAPLDRPVNKLKAYTGCALFCVLVAVFFDPLGTASRVNATNGVVIHKAGLVPGTAEPTDAEKANAKAMLEELQALGVVARIESDATAVTHYVTESFRDLSDEVVEAYTRAALVHHLYIRGGMELAVVIRDNQSGRRIAVREPSGRFHRF